MLFRALETARALWCAGERRAAVLEGSLRETIEREPLARLDYAAAADPAAFQRVERPDGPVRLLVAAFIGRTRLIDNLLLADDSSPP